MVVRLIRKFAFTPSTDALVKATAAVSLFLLILVGTIFYMTAQGRLGDARQNRSDEIRSCSSSFSAELVTGPTADGLKALANYGADSTQFRRAVARMDPERFIRLARLSRTDPSQFLEICRNAPP